MSFSKPFGAKSAALGVEGQAEGVEQLGQPAEGSADFPSRRDWAMGGQGPFLRLHLYCRHLTLLGDMWGLPLEGTGIQASDELSLMPPLVYRGQNPGV